MIVDQVIQLLMGGKALTTSELVAHIPELAGQPHGEELLRLLLPYGSLSLEALCSWLEALLQAGILEARGENLTLGRDFSRLAFEAQYYQALVKAPKPYRARLVETLKGE